MGLLYQPGMMTMLMMRVMKLRIGRENRSTGRIPAPVPLYPTQIPHDLTLGMNLKAGD
jgi:hypothetical protein